MAEPPLLALAGIRYHLGDQTILDGVDLDIEPGRRIGLTGPNGVGKSTLLRVLAGLVRSDGGRFETTPPNALRWAFPLCLWTPNRWPN